LSYPYYLSLPPSLTPSLPPSVPQNLAADLLRLLIRDIKELLNADGLVVTLARGVLYEGVLAVAREGREGGKRGMEGRMREIALRRGGREGGREGGRGTYRE